MPHGRDGVASIHRRARSGAAAESQRAIARLRCLADALANPVAHRNGLQRAQQLRMPEIFSACRRFRSILRPAARGDARRIAWVACSLLP
jgi:hypothetical protein